MTIFTNHTRNNFIHLTWTIFLLLMVSQGWSQASLSQSFSSKIVRYITQGTDDAGTEPGGCNFSTSDDNVYLGECSNGQDIVSGFRFQNIPISNADEIQNALIEFTVDGRYENDIHIRFYGDASDNSETFSSTNKPSDRTLTTQYVDWHLTSSDIWNWTEKHNSPNLTPILKEIVSRPGWNKGNAISIIAKNVSSNKQHRRVFGFDRQANTTKLILEVPHPVQNDLTVGWINRLPEIDYVWGSTNPAVDGWPAAGQEVTWQAHVKNWSSNGLQQVPYRWMMDSVEIASGSVNIPAGTYATVDYPWNWTFDRHELEFMVDPDNTIAEDEEGNNSLLIYTDAITVGFYVEQSLYDYFREHQYKLGVQSTCWENWAQRQVRRWNQMLENAIYEETPDGILDRIRLDKITVVADGALPLAGGLPTNNPNSNDRTVDLQWGFPATHLNSDFYKDHTNVNDSNPFYYEGSLFHELGHARYLIDTYGFDVHDKNGNTIAIKEDSVFIAGTKYMPKIAWDVVYYTEQQGLMGGNYTWIDRYSAMALNLIAGHRATLGNYNAPGNIGVFLNRDLPAENRLTVKDTSGQVLAHANLKIYQSSGKAEWYGKYYDDIPDLELTTNANGEILLGRCPFDNDGTIEHKYGQANGTIIIRVEHAGSVGYAFLEATKFNIEYWRSHTSIGEYEILVNMIDQTVPVELVSFEAEVTQNTVTLFWSTASETNNYGFEIQRSQDKATFEKVGFVSGRNTSMTPRNYRFVDSNRNPGIYFYRLKQIEVDGSFEYTGIVEVFVDIPGSFDLSQNFPNPFNPETQINYQVSEKAEVKLDIFNLLGQHIKTLVDKAQAPGCYSILWDGKSDQDKTVPSGLYIYTLRANHFTATKKMLIIQ